MIERPGQAFEFFMASDLDCAWIDGRLFTKTSKHAANRQFGIEYALYSESLSGAGAPGGALLRARLQLMFPDLRIHERQLLSLSRAFLGWVERGQKDTTIRFKRGAIEYPASTTLPMFRTEQYEPVEQGKTPRVGTARIGQVAYKAFGDLDEADAKRDGFRSLTELLVTLKEIYGVIADDEMVTIYGISLDAD